jgi:hypothetical protein
MGGGGGRGVRARLGLGTYSLCSNVLRKSPRKSWRMEKGSHISSSGCNIVVTTYRRQSKPTASGRPKRDVNNDTSWSSKSEYLQATVTYLSIG